MVFHATGLIFMKLRYTLNYNYMHVHVQAALVHFDGWFYSLM
jgi:hypothetical protein